MTDGLTGNHEFSAFYLDLQVRYSFAGDHELYIGGKNVFNDERPLL